VVKRAWFGWLLFVRSVKLSNFVLSVVVVDFLDEAKARSLIFGGKKRRVEGLLMRSPDASIAAQ
jgi:hypothetical protein